MVSDIFFACSLLKSALFLCFVFYSLFQVQQAKDLAGEVRDLNPYCVIAAGKSRFKTKPVHLSKDPVWDETFAVYVCLMALFLKVFHNYF